VKANDPVALKERDRQDKLAAKQLHEDLTEILKLPAGRRVLWSYLSFCGIHREVFSTNALQMAFNDGRRTVGLKIEDDIITTNAQAYLAMLTERVSKEEVKDG
jgi:hypothetical protein